MLKKILVVTGTWEIIFAITWMLILSAASVMAQIPLQVSNSGFEDETLKPWEWIVVGNCEATGELTPAEKHSGLKSFKVSRVSPKTTNVYGSLVQTVKVEPSSKYRFSVWVKGSNVTQCKLICGKGWTTRKGIPDGTFDWQKVELEYTTLADEATLQLVVVSDGPTEALWVDDVEIVKVGEVAVSQADERKIYEPALWTGIPAAGAFYPILPVGEKLPKVGIFSDKNPRFGANVEIGRTATDFQLSIDVEDTTFGNILSGEQMWRGDSLQLSIDIGNGSSKAEVANTYFELGFALQPNGEVATYAWVGNFNWSEVKTKGEKTEKGYKLFISIPWKNIYLDPTKLPRSIGMNIVINDADKDGVRRFVEWTPGTATTKNPDVFARVFIADTKKEKSVSYIKIYQSFYDSKDAVQGHYIEYAIGDLPAATLTLVAGENKVMQQPVLDPIQLKPFKEGSTRRVNFNFPAMQLSKEGEYNLAAEVAFEKESAKQVATASILRLDLTTKITKELAQSEARLSALKKQMEAKPKLAGDSYLEAGFATVKRFVDRVRENLSSPKQGVEWSNLQMDEIKVVMDQIEKRISNTQVAEKVASPGMGAVTLKDGFFYSKPENDPKGAERLFYYCGYGHFGSVRRDAALLATLGSSIIQQEGGPRGIKADMTLDEGALKGVQNSLDVAMKNGMKMDLLLSPHYFPKWAIEKEADLALKEGSGFIKHNIDHPLAKKIQEAWLRNIVSKVKDHPALFSFGLSNEPVWNVSGYDEYSHPEWVKYLKERHQTIDALNKLYQTHYKSFEEVVLPSKKIMPEGVNEQRAFYDWVVFNMEHFAGWHRWMNGIVKSIAPNIPTHAKVMAEIFDRNRISRGVDPELFCEITDLGGNDCWAWPRPVEFYAYNWQLEEMWYDLLHSFKGQSVFNSENHFITDRTPAKPINPEHTRCIFWQGALHHQGVTTTWAWEEATAPDLEGSIYFRPANIYAASRAMFDLNRLADSVKSISESKGEVALLYSVTSIFWEEDYTKALATAYASLNFSGQQVTYISEKQLASGQRSSANEKVRYIIIPRATHVKESTVKALADFVSKGGKVLTFGSDNLKYDEYHRELKLPASLENMPSIKWEIARDEKVSADLRAGLEKLGLKTTSLLHITKNEPTWGLEYRVVPQGKGTLVSITNILNKPQEFRAPFKGKAVDLLSGKTMNLQKLELAPMESLLLQID